MRKKIILCLFFFVFFYPISAFELRYYEDYYSGYSGYAAAEYVGTTRDTSAELFHEMFKAEMIRTGCINYSDCLKLSKQENYLLFAALEEYDYRNNEIYCVSIVQSGNTELYLTVVITNNGKNCNWMGVYFYN